MSRLRTGPVGRIALLGVLLAGATARAQEEFPLDELFTRGADWVRQNLPEGLLEDLEAPTPEDWELFWTDVQETLRAQSLDDLAWMRPYVETAVEYLRAIEGGAPYADWLEQRLDYFEMAGTVLEEVPQAPPQPPAPRPAPPRVRLAPPARPPPRPPPPEVGKRRLTLVRSRESWKRKLSARQAPAGAQALVPRLKDIFKRQGVPPEWVWIAEVESSFNPAARSPAGAAGLFQFMPATARRFGLRTWPRDERLVPERSAEAAARYLRILHRQFGSWPLALAAYNAGEGNVARALKKSREKTFEAVEDSLPIETQMYVPKVMAVVALREGVDPAALGAPAARRSLPQSLAVLAWLPAL